MKVSELKEGMFIVVDEPYNYGSLGKYLSHTIEEDEDGEYVTDDIEEIETTEDIVRSLYFNNDRFNKIHVFMNRKRNYVLVTVHEQHNKCEVKVICDRDKKVINDIFPFVQGCHFLSRLRRCTEDEKERLIEIIRTKCIDCG